jgi:tetratricopeptide (TPR) repeat protein/predicted Ser/Thr protein kinase
MDDHPTTPPDVPGDTRPGGTSDPFGHARAAPTEVPLPERIGGYVISGVIGSGGMGVVYLAEQPSPRRTVALKVLRHGIASPQMLRRFEHEAIILGRLQHPGIAQIYEAGTADGGPGGPRPFFAMEYIRGRTLTDYVGTRHLDTRLRLALFIEICEAVQYAHTKGIIHRDLKPANILVNEHGHPKVLDFGVARLTDADLQVTAHTDVGQFVGTLPYMSPEQVGANPDDMDTRSDVYALGVVLYELLAGRLPYSLESRTLPEIVRIIREEEPTRLAGISRAFRGDLDTITRKALEKDKARRYQSAGDLAADINNYLRDLPIVAHPPTAIYQMRKFAQRNKTLVASAATFVIALSGGIVATSRQALVSSEQRDRAVEAERLEALRAVEAERARAAEAQQRLIAERALTEARDAQAAAEAQRRLAQASEASARAVSGFLVDMLASATPEIAQGADVLVRDVVDQAALKIAGAFPGQALVEAEVRLAIGAAYFSLGDFDAAKPHIEWAYEARRRELGEEHTSTVDAMGEVASVLDAQGKVQEAEPLYRRVVELCERHQGLEARNTVVARSNLGRFLESDGRLDEAAPYLEQAAAEALRLFGPEDELTIGVNQELAILRSSQGRAAEAEQITRSTLEVRRRTKGETHPDTIASIINMAYYLQEQGRLDEAEAFYRESVDIQKRVMGERHPMVLTATNNLAGLLFAQGKLDEAAAMYLSVLEARRARLGDEHNETLASANNYGALLIRLGRMADAEAVFRRNLEIQERTIGPTHAHTLGTMSNLAHVLSNLKQYEEAERLYREAVARRATIESTPSPDAIRTMHGLGQVLAEQKKCDEAMPLVEQTLAAAVAMHGEEHAVTYTVRANYARTLRDCGRPADAIPEFEKLIASVSGAAGENDPRLASYRVGIALCHVRLGRYEEAEPELLAHYQRAVEAGGTEGAKPAAARLVELYTAWGKAEEAKKYE